MKEKHIFPMILTLPLEKQRLVSLVKQTGGTCYLSGKSGKDYLEEELFHKEGIEVVYQKFIHPVYYVKNEKECVKVYRF